MYIRINAGIDRAKTLYKLINGAKPQDLIVKPPFSKSVQKMETHKSNSCIVSGLMVSIKNILNIISKGK